MQIRSFLQVFPNTIRKWYDLRTYISEIIQKLVHEQKKSLAEAELKLDI